MTAEIWVVDDDDSLRWVLEKALTQAGHNARCFANAEKVLGALTNKAPDVLVSDIRMPGKDGLALLEQLQKSHPRMPVVIMTAHTDLDSAVAAYSGGAFEYIPKPFDLDDAISIIERAISRNGGMPANEEPLAPATAGMLGNAASMQEVFRLIGRLSKSELGVLIGGETGTGKELVAQALHQTSLRSRGPFIALNTAAIPSELLESELFGHEKGAFTGAHNRREGRFEQANQGTLFLDEIGDMPADMQTRLLRVLAEGDFYRVGGHELIRVDVRVIAATHQDLEAKVAAGDFREDLFHRLNVVKIHLPALRDRREDIELLANYFLHQAADESNLKPKTLSRSTLTSLADYDWPGNVRELSNLCRRLTVMAPSDLVQSEDLPAEFGQSKTDPATQSSNSWKLEFATWVNRSLAEGRLDVAKDATNHFEKILLEQALAFTLGKKQAAAKLLGWGRNTLTRKLALLENERDSSGNTD